METSLFLRRRVGDTCSVLLFFFFFFSSLSLYTACWPRRFVLKRTVLPCSLCGQAAKTVVRNTSGPTALRRSRFKEKKKNENLYTQQQRKNQDFLDTPHWGKKTASQVRQYYTFAWIKIMLVWCFLTMEHFFSFIFRFLESTSNRNTHTLAKPAQNST